MKASRDSRKRDEAYRLAYVRDCQRSLHEKPILQQQQQQSSSLQLFRATSIHGNGDKIALPPSVLENLARSITEDVNEHAASPWTFRIGIPNPGYKFPASPLVKVLRAPTEEDDDAMSDDDEDITNQRHQIYLDELNHKYLAYTHCTVVEFTQEEGHVGIPRHIAEALLDTHTIQSEKAIPTTRTVDPAAAAAVVDMDEANDGGGDDDSDQTPGHLAWGAFDIPDLPLEITMVRLPKGTGCTLVPTAEAVRQNFYGLKDVKLVLEQSLIRTRATLSVGDKVSTWHRGTKYVLAVTKVLPSSVRAVTCINTDINVELGDNEKSSNTTTSNDADDNHSTSAVAASSDTNTTTGFRLGSGSQSTASSSPQTTTEIETPAQSMETTTAASLSPEPPIDQKEGVCTVLVRYSGGNGKRRFAVDAATVHDLFLFSSTLLQKDPNRYRLVTRFPRRELTLAIAGTTLRAAGLSEGQELVLVEDL